MSADVTIMKHVKQVKHGLSVEESPRKHGETVGKR